jgi:hypothetical protein
MVPGTGAGVNRGSGSGLKSRAGSPACAAAFRTTGQTFSLVAEGFSVSAATFSLTEQGFSAAG